MKTLRFSPVKPWLTASLPFLALCPAHAQVAQTQPALPPTAPTQTVTASQLPSANPPVALRAARIEWDGHLLQFTAEGTSLQQALQQIGARTGMRVLGSPPDDRIFGTYGPAPLADIVSELVEGLAVNVIFAGGTATHPAELTLSPRNGGAAPAGSSPQQAVAQPQPQPTYPPPQNAYQPPPPQNQPPTTPQFGSNPGGQAIGSADNATAGDAGNVPQSPNGVKTPQEIFEQLQRLRATAAGRQQ